MSSIFLIEVLSEFDINVKYFKINVKNQLNRNYGLFYWFLCFVSFSVLLINTFILVFISDDDIHGLNNFGSLGFKLAGKTSRFMLDASYVMFNLCIFIILLNYSFDKMQWLLKMSSIYKEIRTKHFDIYLMNCAKSLSFYFKIGSTLAIISAHLLNLCIIYFKWDQVIDYPIGFILFSFTFHFASKFGCTLSCI